MWKFLFSLSLYKKGSTLYVKCAQASLLINNIFWKYFMLAHKGLSHSFFPQLYNTPLYECIIIYSFSFLCMEIYVVANIL